jgi:hypothetical protein
VKREQCEHLSACAGTSTPSRKEERRSEHDMGDEGNKSRGNGNEQRESF